MLSHIEFMLDRVPRDAKLLTVIDGHPATLSWLGGVCGHSTLAQGLIILVRQGQSTTFINTTGSTPLPLWRRRWQ